MKRILIPLIFLIPVTFFACVKISYFEKPEIEIRVDKISLNDMTAFDSEKFLEFDLYLDRPDLKISEPINDGNFLTSDLPLELQPKLIYVSDINDKEKDSGTMCDRPRFPHRCSVAITDDGKNKNNFLIKVTFEDGSYAEKEITISAPKALEKPEILEPNKTPDRQEKLNLKFKNVGADSYNVSVNLCSEYANDGINPCLDGISYNLKKENESVIFNPLGFGDEIYKPIVKLEDGIIRITSDFPLVFKNNIEYTVVASFDGKNSDGIKTRVENSDFKTFK